MAQSVTILKTLYGLDSYMKLSCTSIAHILHNTLLSTKTLMEQKKSISPHGQKASIWLTDSGEMSAS